MYDFGNTLIVHIDLYLISHIFFIPCCVSLIIAYMPTVYVKSNPFQNQFQMLVHKLKDTSERLFNSHELVTCSDEYHWHCMTAVDSLLSIYSLPAHA